MVMKQVGSEAHNKPDLSGQLFFFMLIAVLEGSGKKFHDYSTKLIEQLSESEKQFFFNEIGHYIQTSNSQKSTPIRFLPKS